MKQKLAWDTHCLAYNREYCCVIVCSPHSMNSFFSFSGRLTLNEKQFKLASIFVEKEFHVAILLLLEVQKIEDVRVFAVQFIQ